MTFPVREFRDVVGGLELLVTVYADGAQLRHRLPNTGEQWSAPYELAEVTEECAS